MISHALLFFRFVFSDLFSITLKEFSRLHYCSVIKVLSVSCCCFVRQLSYINMLFLLCQQLFLFFSKTFLAFRRSHESYNDYDLFSFYCLATALLDYHVVFLLSTTFLIIYFYKNPTGYFTT